ncbi:MAG: SDH family Clp fold serine proteinase, partial [Chloroflexota bacterium]
MSMRAFIEAIESHRSSTVLVLGASSLDIELLPMLYDSLREIGRIGSLDVLLYCRGGLVSGARRIALLLHEHTDSLGFI